MTPTQEEGLNRLQRFCDSLEPDQFNILNNPKRNIADLSDQALLEAFNIQNLSSSVDESLTPIELRVNHEIANRFSRFIQTAQPETPAV